MPAKPFRPKPEAGDVFEHPYPFVRDTFTDDRDGEGPVAVFTWKPGVRMEPDGSVMRFGELECRGSSGVADAIGKQIITVLGRFKPAGFPERVFFKRHWRDPDGKAFGKHRLHVKTIGCFRGLISGYRHPYKLRTDAPKQLADPKWVRPAGFVDTPERATGGADA